MGHGCFRGSPSKKSTGLIPDNIYWICGTIEATSELVTKNWMPIGAFSCYLNTPRRSLETERSIFQWAGWTRAYSNTVSERNYTSIKLRIKSWYDAHYDAKIVKDSIHKSYLITDRENRIQATELNLRNLKPDKQKISKPEVQDLNKLIIVKLEFENSAQISTKAAFILRWRARRHSITDANLRSQLTSFHFSSMNWKCGYHTFMIYVDGDPLQFVSLSIDTMIDLWTRH